MSTRLKPKLLSVMKTYNKEQFVKDVIAGLIVAIIALPLSIALAISSGVSPEQGLYTAIIAGFFISCVLIFFWFCFCCDGQSPSPGPSFFFFLMTRRPPSFPFSSSSAASDVYKRQFRYGAR